jgi:ribonuclease G
MIREMYVSSTTHETKVALAEDDQLAELFFERENEYTLAGSIYKGRVTRVLPGMQSAFVDIGLERDAFLYVSDFLELPEDEESEFEEIAVTHPETFVTRRPPQEPQFEFKPDATPHAAESEKEPSQEAMEAAAPEFTEPEAPAEAEGEDTQDPGFRGNRRRRRSRRRGFPESKFVQPEAQEESGDGEQEYAPPPPHVLLPGESISKYQGREQPPAEGPTEPPVEAAPVQEREPRPPKPDSRSAGREEFRSPEPPPARMPIVLPGESIAKYQPRAESVPPPARTGLAGEPVQTAPEPDAQPVKSEVEPQPAANEPIERETRTVVLRRDRESAPSYGPGSGRFTLLPGESIAKYQPRQDLTARPPQEQPAEAEPRTEAVSASFVIESEPWTEELQTEHKSTQPELPQPPQDLHAISVDTSDTAASLVEEETPSPAGQSVEASEAEVGTESVVERQPVEPPLPEAALPAVAASGTPGLGGERTDVRNGEQVFGATGAGTLEHEEIEGDEAELHPPSEEESDSEFLELEEESFEREGYRPVDSSEVRDGEPLAARTGGAIPAEGLTQAVEEINLERAVFGDAYETEEGEEVEPDLSFEEEALETGDELDPADKQQEEAAGSPRAELRGPGVTAGYPRTDRGFDRQRGRRLGGRPMRRREPPRQHVPISDLLREGQEILVQIAKEPIGKKGARITSHIALPGRFLVYMPTVNHVGVSRKITSEEERQRLKRIMLSEREGGHGGFIVRTAAAGIGESELRADIRFLKNLWGQIKQRADSGKAPALIYHDLNLVERILRDLVTSDFSQIWVDSEQEYERILNFANRFQPSLVRRVKLYTKSTPLFEQFGINEEITKVLRSKVWLKSGGYIVINQTEALVAIDVNTGKYVGKTARLEDTIVKTNVDAIREIVRQIRLRDLGGIIVIDFIDMDERKNRQKVMQALDEALKSDRSPSKVLAFNDFGLVAITRKRVKQSLERTLCASCPYCEGTGFVKSVSTICNEIYAELRKMRDHLEDDVVNLRVNPEVAKALKASGGRWLQDFEELTGRSILVKPDTQLHQGQFDIH